MLKAKKAVAKKLAAGLRSTGRASVLGAAAVLCAALFAAGTVRAQTAEDALRYTRRAPAVSDARSLGRGGAGRAGIAGPTALFYNPAGLGWMTSSEAGGALAFIGTRDEGRFRGLDETSTRDYGGHAALAYKFPTARGSLVFAGAYDQTNTFGRELGFRGENSQSSITRFLLPYQDEYRLDGDFIEWTGSVLPQAAYEAGAIEFYDDSRSLEECEFYFCPAVKEGRSTENVGAVDEEGRQSEISFGAGVAAAPKVMLGLSANVALGRYQHVNQLSELDNGANDDYEVIRGGATYRGLDEVRFEERFESDLTGLSLRAGLSAKAAPGVRLGLTLESPTFYTVNETYTEAQITTFFDDGGQLSYGGRSGDAGVGEIEYQVRTPWRLGAGAQANLLAVTDGVADLTLSGDVELVDWSQLDLDSDVDDFEDQNQIAEDDFRTVVNTNLGAEFRTGGAALRAGFAYRPDARDPESSAPAAVTTDAPDTDRLFYSFGAGYRFSGRLQVDVGWMQERFEDTFRPYGGDAAPRVDEDVTRNRFLVGVRYFF